MAGQRTIRRTSAWGGGGEVGGGNEAKRWIPHGRCGLLNFFARKRAANMTAANIASTIAYCSKPRQVALCTGPPTGGAPQEAMIKVAIAANGADEGKADHQASFFNLLGYLVGSPCLELFDLRTDLGEFTVEVHSQKAQYLSQHQPRPRTIRPITIPTASAPARAPSGFLRAIPSSSVANVLNCSVADEAISAPVLARPLVVEPTCDATA